MPRVGSSRGRATFHGKLDPADATIPIQRLVPIANFDTFGGEAICRIIGAHAMPHNWPNSVPEPVKDQKPVDDFFASKLADRIRIDNWRKKLTCIRGEILEIAEQGSQRGLVDVKRETVKLARSIERLEALLGLKAPQ